MASRPPPRFVVRKHDDADHRRRRLWLGSAWLASLLLAGLAAGLLSRRVGPTAVDRRQQNALRTRIESLQQQVANLQRDAQVNDIATRSLRVTLTQRDGEISGLRADLDFYARLVSGDEPPQSLKLQKLKLEPIPGSRGWNLTLSLTQNVKRGDETAGNVTLDVEGLRGYKVVQLDWTALGNASQKDGLTFRLMYFQQLHGTIVLPADVRPMRLHVSIQPAGGPTVTRTIAWDDALAGNIITQGDHDAQP